MSYKRLNKKVVCLNDFELHCCEVLKQKYRINPSHFIREAFVEKLRRDMPQIRERFKKSDIAF